MSDSAVDLTTGSYNEEGVFRQHNDDSETSETFNLRENLSSLKNFRTSRIIKENLNEKYLVLEGNFVGDDKPAIVIVEKIPFSAKDLPRIFSAESRLELKFRNNIYSNYHVFPASGFNGHNVKVIYPATDKDFNEYIDEKLTMVKEHIELYKSVVLPHFQAISSVQVCPQPKESIIFEKEDAVCAFKLAEDELKNCTCSEKHIRAVCVLQQREILSLRDLTEKHLPMLSLLKKECLVQLSAKHSISPTKLLCYIRYPPKQFPFHIIFETVEKDAPIPAEKAHHLETVIFNLQMVPDYYQRVDLNYSLDEKDSLLHKIRSASPE